MRFCPQCGTSIETTAQFCRACGGSLPASKPAEGPQENYPQSFEQSQQYPPPPSYEQTQPYPPPPSYQAPPAYQPAPGNYPVPSAYPPAPDAKPAGAEKKLAAGLCGILIGSLGIHKFILGYNTEGLILLLATVLTCGIGSIVTAIIGIVEGIIYLTKSDADFVNTYVLNKKAWF